MFGLFEKEVLYSILKPEKILVQNFFGRAYMYPITMKYILFKLNHVILTKCYEPLQKLRVRLGTCKTGLSPPVSLCY